MQLSITQKLGLCFVGVTAVVLGASLLLARWSFNYGFLEYVNEVERLRLERIALDLAAWHSSTDGWQRLTERRFRQLLRNHAPRGESSPGPRAEHAGGPGTRPPPRRARDERGPPRGEPRPPRHPREGARRGRPPPPAAPTALLDSEKNLVAGSLDAVGLNRLEVPVVASANDKVVGYLVTRARERLELPQETAFAGQQLSAMALIGLGAIVLAVVISAMLARGLVQPIRRMMLRVDSLAKGRYDEAALAVRDDELGQLAADLNRLNVALRENRDARQRWLADVSHELRTPVSVLSAELEALKDGVREMTVAQLDSFDQEVARLRSLIQDLYELSVSDVGGLHYDFARTDASQLLQRVFDNFSNRTELGAVGQVSDNLVVRADPVRLEQLFVNLLENSARYTDVPGTVRLSAARQEQSVVVVIDDSEPAVDAALLESLFDPLVRAEPSRSRATAGAGLGLAICRNIVAAHEGEIGAAHSELGGLKITVRLPAL